MRSVFASEREKCISGNCEYLCTGRSGTRGKRGKREVAFNILDRNAESSVMFGILVVVADDEGANAEKIVKLESFD